MNDDSAPTPWRAKECLIFTTLSILCLISMSLTAAKCRVFAVDQCTTKYKDADRGVATEQEDSGDATKPPERGGLILWSYGRSGTGSLMETVWESSQMKYCNGKKESFNRSPRLWKRKRLPELNPGALQKCIDRDERLIHVKPEHLLAAKSQLRTPEAFFDAAYKAGFRTVMASFRENQLAGDISTYRLKARKSMSTFQRAKQIDSASHPLHGVHAFHGLRGFSGNIIECFEALRKQYNSGVKAAQKIGFTIVPCNFADLVLDVCTCAGPALRELRKNTINRSFECQVHMDHVEDANNTKKTNMSQYLATLLGPEEAEKLRASLLGTAYQWMLDLEATDWPKDVAPPVPVPTWRRHRNAFNP